MLPQLHPPADPPSIFHATLSIGLSKLGELAARSVIITNVAKPRRKMIGCQVKLEQMDGWPKGMLRPLALRTETQIRGKRCGRWMLLPMESVSVPIFFRGAIRFCEWFFFDERGERYYKPARSTRMVLGVKDGEGGSNTFLVHLKLGSDWVIEPSIEPVSKEYVLKGVADAATGKRTALRTEKSRAGRKSLQEKDAPLVDEGVRMVRDGEVASRYAAAQQLAPRAFGNATEDSKRRRLHGRIKSKLDDD